MCNTHWRERHASRDSDHFWSGFIAYSTNLTRWQSHCRPAVHGISFFRLVRRPPYNLQEGAGFGGWTIWSIFFTMIQQIDIVFNCSVDKLFISLSVGDVPVFHFFLIYFNSCQLQIKFILPSSCLKIFMSEISHFPLEIKWWSRYHAWLTRHVWHSRVARVRGCCTSFIGIATHS